MISAIGNKKGFTLLEVLLAVVIAGISLTVIVRSLLNGWRVVVQGREHLQAAILLENKIFELWTEPRTLSASQGDFPEPFERFHYVIAEDSSADGEDKVASKIEVSWISGQQKKSITTGFIP